MRLLLSVFTLMLFASISEAAPRVLIISVDGLRREFLEDSRYETPNLRRLRDQGAYSLEAVPVFPSLTYPNHTTLITGTSSAAHGVLSNTAFDPSDGSMSRWYFNASDVKAPTLWQKAKQAGKSVAILRWPATVGAPVDWMFPEIFLSPGFDAESDWELIQKNVRPEFLAEVMAEAPIRKLSSVMELDGLMAHATSHVLRKYKPDLTLVHLIKVDLVQHGSGRLSPETAKAVKETDEHIGKIFAALDPETTMLIVGDHGFLDFQKSIELNVLFREQGWLKTKDGALTEWTVLAHAEGGQAAVYTKDKSLAPRIRSVLQAQAKGRFRIIERRELDRFKAYPDALFGIEAVPGWALGSATEGQVIRNHDAPRGAHGYLPGRKQMHTVLLAVGPGVRRKKNLGRTELLQVAPTAAAILGVPLPTAERKPLKLK